MSQKTLSPAAEKDIRELKTRIEGFIKGQEDEDRFKLYRLTRGVYGQRQQGVQMLRIKLPYGKITPDQLRTMADLSETYTKGNLHLTTRQNIQLHYVRLTDSPAIWEALERSGVTAREACGNTVRNITASPYAGIDPEEPFDVSPYAHAVFEYFLRNPICQDMGRKIKMAFSASDRDQAFTFIHDFGFIPRIHNGEKGFKVIIGGGLGAQPFLGQVAHEFLPTNQLIPFIEAGLRVFDRFGERERRLKARLKYLIEPNKGIGVDGFLKLVEKERKALAFPSFPISEEKFEYEMPETKIAPGVEIEDPEAFEIWKISNVFEQKQKGHYAVQVRVPLGNIDVERARRLADIAQDYATDDIRLTINQGLLFRFVKPHNIEPIYAALKKIGLAEPGFDTLADITACPGTDTCNLGVTDSTAISNVLSDLIKNDFPHLINESNIKIKISGCMNSCGQHMFANIGFHGSSIKVEGKVCPAMQVVIGGGVSTDGKSFIAERVIKLPTKRIPKAVTILLEDFESNAEESEYFNDYFNRKGKIYFYDLLKHLGDTSTLTPEDYQDWGEAGDYVQEIGVGECAGVVLDLVGTILTDAEQHLKNAEEALSEALWANAIYYTYNSQIIGAKGILLSKDVKCNTHQGIIDDFQKEIILAGFIDLPTSFDEQVLQINQYEPTEGFARKYFTEAQDFLRKLIALRKADQTILDENKKVISAHYKA